MDHTVVVDGKSIFRRLGSKVGVGGPGGVIIFRNHCVLDRTCIVFFLFSYNRRASMSQLAIRVWNQDLTGPGGPSIAIGPGVKRHERIKSLIKGNVNRGDKTTRLTTPQQPTSLIEGEANKGSPNSTLDETPRRQPMTRVSISSGAPVDASNCWRTKDPKTLNAWVKTKIESVR